MPAFRDLTAAQGSLIGSLLRDKKTRDAERAFVLEGVKPIQEALHRRPHSLQLLVVTPQFLESCEGPVRTLLQAHAASARVSSGRAFRKIADVVSPAGILAVLEQPRWDQEAVFKRGTLFGLYGECLQDPGNVGVIVRTAAALGVDAVWLSTDSADLFSPKVVRATAGTLFELPIFPLPSPRLFQERHCALFAAQAAAEGSRPITDIRQVPGRAVLAFGNESRGLSDTTRRQATERFHIVTTGGVDSLNVATSAAIAIFYFKRLQRESGRGR